MENLYWIILFVLTICSCKAKTENSANVNDVQQEDSVNAVDTLRNFVFKIYKHSLKETKTEVLDSLYLSSEWYFLEKEYKKILLSAKHV
jgi:hypothetical protein